MRKFIFSGMMTMGILLSLQANAQERLRSNQIERQINDTEQRIRNDYRNTTDSLQRQFDLTRSQFQNVGDTLRHEYNRNRSNFRNASDTIRSEYDRTRSEYKKDMKKDRMKKDSLERAGRMNRRNL